MTKGRGKANRSGHCRRITEQTWLRPPTLEPQWVAHQQGAVGTTRASRGGRHPYDAQDGYLLRTKCAHFLTHSQHWISTQFCASVTFSE